ncbi:unnamed protein product [Pleuronectes platessa]|uniref:Uncharacterized protein n=1 Tax=Pleuronectes platessa TaxID=8262 RepID=A0A9N7VCJ6_PLEPL|nr:unnamed protein product [Pleuronectes platessa]
MTLWSPEFLRHYSGGSDSTSELTSESSQSTCIHDCLLQQSLALELLNPVALGKESVLDPSASEIDASLGPLHPAYWESMTASEADWYPREFEVYSGTAYPNGRACSSMILTWRERKGKRTPLDKLKRRRHMGEDGLACSKWPQGSHFPQCSNSPGSSLSICPFCVSSYRINVPQLSPSMFFYPSHHPPGAAIHCQTFTHPHRSIQVKECVISQNNQQENRQSLSSIQLALNHRPGSFLPSGGPIVSDVVTSLSRATRRRRDISA